MRLAAYRLALALGWFNVDAMLSTGTAQHLEEWQEYYDLEPYGQPWKLGSLLAARTINTILAVAPRDSKEQPDFYDDDAFVPMRKHAEEAQAEIEAKCKAADDIEGFGV